MVKKTSLYTYNKVRYWLLKTPWRPVHHLYNPETCVVHYQHCMKCNGPGGKFGQLQQGKVLIVNNLVAACTSTVQPWNLSFTLPTSYTVSWSKSQICTPTTRLGTDYWKRRSGLYINCATLKLVVYITYIIYSVIVKKTSFLHLQQG